MMQTRKQVLWNWKILNEIDKELKVIAKDPIKPMAFYVLNVFICTFKVRISSYIFILIEIKY